ncbi:hypothetical protein [Tritonibacter scottomollicae]
MVIFAFPFAAPNACLGEAHGEVGFFGPCAADLHDVTLRLKELAGGQIAHQRLVDRRVHEVELVDLICERELGNCRLVFDRPSLLLADLGVQKVTDDLLRLVLPHHPFGDDLILGGRHAVELRRAHRVQHL